MPETPESDTVEFVARYKIAGRAHRLHEVSRFVRDGDDAEAGQGARWFYLDGSFPGQATPITHQPRTREEG